MVVKGSGGARSGGPDRVASVRIARYTTGEDPTYGIVEGEPDAQWIAEIQGDPLYQPVVFTGNRVRLDEVRLLAPIIPRSKVIGIGKNYADHAAEMGGEAPLEPLIFLKPNTAVVGPGDPVVMPRQSGEVHYEGELAVVISRLCKDVPINRVADVIFGYTCANDVTARDLQRTDGQWARAKGFDTFCPIGPWIETDIDPSDLSIVTRRDGEVVQDGRTVDMVHDVAAIVSYVSEAFTLLPGDVILTGTPAGIGPVTSGQRVEVEIEGIGILSNPFIRRD
jgi:2-keto-4-pentenoate hydratase/2-oxohepta-3-ene-1,7-dioic acid hydratase in catechol pathway